VSRRPVIGLTAGDPAGIGAELLEKVFQSAAAVDADLRIIGPDRPIRPGQPDEETARLALYALEEAAVLALNGELDAIVTGPVCKHNMHEVGFAYPGQTEFFAARSGVEKYAMLLTGGPLTIVLATAHVPLKEVSVLLDEKKIVVAGELLLDFLRLRGRARPQIAVTGLNPHAGEQGDLGSEEEEVIAPAVASLQKLAPEVFSGPHSPDTVFMEAANGAFDAVVCMFHDQGLIPLKLLAFDLGVNVTLGLPFIRTSPDHGTAFSLAGRGIARADSMIQAAVLAAELVRAKKEHSGHKASS